MLLSFPTLALVFRYSINHSNQKIPSIFTNSIHQLKPQLSRMSTQFCLNDYDAIGFDLDNTLAVYNLKNLLSFEYECLAKYLVEQKNYSGEILNQPLDGHHIDFFQRGLLTDNRRGNLLKLGSSGKILKASHGERLMSTDEIKKIYGEACEWNVTNEFVNDFLSTWNGPLSEEMRAFLDFFDTPGTLIFARAVDTLDKANGGSLDDYKHVYQDMLDGFLDMYTPSQFALNQGCYFPELKRNPDLHHKSSSEVLNWLKELKAKGKTLFLLTGSYVDHATHTATHCLGENWEQYFDFIGFYSKKPGFFNGVNRPFLKITNLKEDTEISPADLLKEKKFSQGNWDGLLTAMKILTNKENLKTLYIGDNLIQDIYTPAKYTSCDTIAIAEELIAEGIEGEESHPHDYFIKSNVWESFFYTHDNVSNSKIATIWSSILKNYAKICVPSIHYLASNSIDKVYSTFKKTNDKKDIEVFCEEGFHPKRRG